MLKKGYYTMDRILSLTGQEDIGDVPLDVLMKIRRLPSLGGKCKGGAALAVPGSHGSDDIGDIPEHCWSYIMSFIPQNQTAFNANRCAIQRYVRNLNDDLSLVVCSAMMKTGIDDTIFRINHASQIVKRVIARDLDNELEMKWAATIGPMPDWVSNEDLFYSMQGAFYTLLDILKDLCGPTQKDLCANLVCDLRTRLSPSWTGVYGWRD